MNPRERTLEQVEGEDWGEPTFGSGLVIRCHELRKVPLADLSAEDLRLLIGQKIGLEHLVPLALNVLAKDPWVEGDLYPGALIWAVVQIDHSFWKEHPAFLRELIEVRSLALLNVPSEADEDQRRVLQALEKFG